MGDGSVVVMECFLHHMQKVVFFSPWRGRQEISLTSPMDSWMQDPQFLCVCFFVFFLQLPAIFMSLEREKHMDSMASHRVYSRQAEEWQSAGNGTSWSVTWGCYTFGTFSGVHKQQLELWAWVDEQHDTEASSRSEHACPYVDHYSDLWLWTLTLVLFLACSRRTSTENWHWDQWTN